MKFQVGDRVTISAARQEGSFRVVAGKKRGPFWEYALENETDHVVRERVAESQIAASGFHRKRAATPAPPPPARPRPPGGSSGGESAP